MKKISIKKEFIGEHLGVTLFVVGIGLMFLGVLISSIALPLDSKVMLIALPLILSGGGGAATDPIIVIFI